MNIKRYRGFTLLELMIVVIIIGVLAALALPKLYRVIEKSRSAEAMSAISSIRVAMENFLIEHPKDELIAYTGGPSEDWKQIGLSDPGKSPGTHFTYILHRNAMVVGNQDKFVIIAVRNCNDSGTPGDIRSTQVNDMNLLFYGLNYDASASSLCGFGIYKGIKTGTSDCNWNTMMTIYGADLRDVAIYASAIVGACAE